MKSKFWVSITASLLLSACATHRVPVKTMDPAEVKLAEAASNVSHSLVHLAAIEQAANPQAKLKPPPNPSSYGMGNLVSIDWAGPIAPLVSRIAIASHYQFRVLGRAPSIPILVTMSVKNVPMGDVLQNAGYQAGSRANIVVFPKKRLVELRYTPV